MKRISQTIIAVAVVAGLALAAAGTAAAQGKSPQTARVRHTPMGRPSSSSEAAPKPKSESFPRGVAAKLGTTAEALQSAYETAKAANPKLSRGQFIAANMVAKNLSSKNPAITADALLNGLKSGKSIGQTLQSLGLSSQDAHEAQRQADRDAKDAAKNQ